MTAYWRFHQVGVVDEFSNHELELVHELYKYFRKGGQSENIFSLDN